MQCLTDWQLSCFYPYVPYYTKSFEVGVRQKGILPQIPAKVPGSVQKALMDAGLLEDPYYEMNSLKAEWVEHKWWVYSIAFQADAGKKWDLVFESLDYKAKIFLNGRQCGESENLFVPLVIRAEPFLKEGKNLLIVVLEGAPSEMAQLGYSEQTHTQKSRFSYKWDFGTRLVHLGIPGRVFLRERKPAEFEKLLFHGTSSGDYTLGFVLRTEQTGCIPLSVTLRDREDQILHERTELLEAEDGKEVRLSGKIDGVRPWYPQGYGEQNLYRLTVELADGFSQTRTVGFKQLSAEKNDPGSDCPYPYLLKVNGCPIYIKGVNLTPLDLLYGDLQESRVETLLKLIRDANVNLIRVWGGGRIESETFYELTDRYGIMVWQEFPQSGAGISSLPPTDPQYLRNLEKTAREAVFKSNHVSLVAFSGGNELSDGNVPVDFSNPNIAMLKSVVDENCPWVLMYPTSGAGGWPMCDLEHKGKLFDVHGPWQYAGDAHYRLYNESDSMLHSEFGCDGMTNRPVFDRFFSPENRKVSNMTENLVWRHHGEWWDTSQRDASIFYPPQTLEEQIAVSQFMQLEGLRYAVEANRRRAYRNSGSIIWQANEPFPNVSCTCLIDYFNCPKPAYYAVRQAFCRVNPSLRYETFVHRPGDTLRAELFVTADGEPDAYLCRCEIYTDDCLTEAFGKEVTVGGGFTQKVQDLNIAVPKCDALLVKMTVEGGGKKYVNTVLFPIRNGERANIAPVLSYIKDINNL